MILQDYKFTWYKMKCLHSNICGRKIIVHQHVFKKLDMKNYFLNYEAFYVLINTR